MKELKNHQAFGQLLTAVTAGGSDALWRIANRPGPVGDLARSALDELTAPNSDCLRADEAVIKIVNGKR
jgi:hypothetical protein